MQTPAGATRPAAEREAMMQGKLARKESIENVDEMSDEYFDLLTNLMTQQADSERSGGRPVRDFTDMNSPRGTEANRRVFIAGESPLVKEYASACAAAGMQVAVRSNAGSGGKLPPGAVRRGLGGTKDTVGIELTNTSRETSEKTSPIWTVRYRTAPLLSRGTPEDTAPRSDGAPPLHSQQ